MGLFSFGGNKSSSSSSSSSFDNLDQSSFNFGAQGSTSSGSSVGTSRQNIAFEDIFASLFGGAAGAAAKVDPSAITGAANMLFGSGTDFLGNLAGGGAGASFLEDRLSGNQALVDEQIGLLGEDITRFLAEDVNTAITSGGVAAGTLGGGRGEVQRGIAARGATEAFARGAADIRSNAQAQTDSIAQFLAGDETMRAGAGLQNLPALLGLAEGGAMAGLSPFAALSQILGGPTVLTQSDSASSQLAEAFGLDFGTSQTTGRAGSQSSSSSSSKGIKFGWG